MALRQAEGGTPVAKSRRRRPSRGFPPTTDLSGGSQHAWMRTLPRGGATAVEWIEIGPTPAADQRLTLPTGGASILDSDGEFLLIADVDSLHVPLVRILRLP